MQLLGLVLLALLIPSSVAAQGVFIQGGPLVDLVATNSGRSPIATYPVPTQSTTYTWNDLNSDRRWQPGEEMGPVVGSSLLFLGQGTTSKQRFAPGGAVAIGVFLSPHVSIRLEGSFQAAHVTTNEISDPRSTIRIVNRSEAATTDAVVSAAWHQNPSRKINVAYLAGMAFRRQRALSTSDLELTGATTQVIFGFPGGPEFESISYRFGAMAGLDVSLELSKHFALVPNVRFVASSGQWNLRPALAMRWTP